MPTWESPEVNRLIAELKAGRTPDGTQYRSTMEQADENAKHLQKVMDALKKSDQKFPFYLAFADAAIRITFMQTGTLEINWTKKNGAHGSVALNREPHDRTWKQGMVALGTIPHKDLTQACDNLFR